MTLSCTHNNWFNGDEEGTFDIAPGLANILLPAGIGVATSIAIMKAMAAMMTTYNAEVCPTDCPNKTGLYAFSITIKMGNQIRKVAGRRVTFFVVTCKVKWLLNIICGIKHPARALPDAASWDEVEALHDNDPNIKKKK